MEGLFKDKVYNEMEWLEAACQPYIEKLNPTLSNFPDKIEITLEHITYSNKEPRSGVFISSLLNSISRENKYGLENLSPQDVDAIEKCFEFKAEFDEGCDQIYFDSETQEITGGKMFLVKVKDIFEEKEIESRVGANGIRRIRMMGYRDMDVNYANDILELFSMDEERKSRSKKVKYNAIESKMQEIMKNNEWNIRDLDLSNRVGKWLVEYLQYGNMAALSNFCKMKAMTHNNEPIYSIEEEAI